MTMVFGYKKFTESGKLLATVMKAEYSYPLSMNACREGDVVINWGAGYGYPHWGDRAKQWVNHPRAVFRSVNKLATFAAIKKAGLGQYIPEVTTSHTTAAEWLARDIVVIARQEVEQKQGKGIVVFDPVKKIKVYIDPNNGKTVPLIGKVSAEVLANEGFRFYTKLFEKKWELKVHVAFGKAWLWWRVEKDKNYYEHRKYIFNFAEGYRFTRCRTDIHPDIKRVCEKVIKAVGLDFGVVDIGIGKNPGEMCVFETNTAPSLDFFDAKAYTEMFRKELKLK